MLRSLPLCLRDAHETPKFLRYISISHEHFMAAFGLAPQFAHVTQTRYTDCALAVHTKWSVTYQNLTERFLSPSKYGEGCHSGSCGHSLSSDNVDTLSYRSPSATAGFLFR